MKTCSKCREEKPLTAFWADNRRKGGKQPYCTDCAKTYQKPHKRNHTDEELEVWLVKQGYRCPICHFMLWAGDFRIDQDRGVISGLLCKHCYLGLGKFNYSIPNLENAIKYLES